MGAVGHELHIQQVDVDQLTQHPDNANSGDVRAIVQSIEVNGFYTPIVAQRKTHQIIAGNHRYLAALQLGMKQVPVVWVEVSDVEAKRIMVADNRTTRLGHDDEAQLADLLETLYETEEGLFGTGYTVDDYTELVELGGEPLAFADPVDEPERHVEFTAGGEKGPRRERLPFTIVANADEDGHCESLTLTKHGFEAISPRDFNALRVAMGMAPLTREELQQYEIPRWHRKG